MTTIMITRHFSGFTNVADSFSIGDNEADGRAAASTYHLPDGYEIDQYDRIYDRTGSEVEILPDWQSGEPVLTSRLSSGLPDHKLVAA